MKSKIKSKYLAIKVSKGLKYTVFATNILAMVLLLLAIQAPFTPPTSFLLVSYLGLGFPVLLLLNIAYLFLWVIFFRWKYIIVQLLVLALCMNAITNYIPMNERSEIIPEDCLKVMSYNVRGFDWLTGDTARKNPILNYIANSGADIICMQEFAIDEKKTRDGMLSLEEFDDIMAEYPYRNIIRLGDVNNSCIYGLACYSKYPIMKVARVPIESLFNGSAMYEIKVGIKRMTIVNNHLESNRVTEEDKQLYKELVKSQNRRLIGDMAAVVQKRMEPAFISREVQANILADCIQQQLERTRYMIVCGDFNDTPISYTYQKIKGNFVDSFRNTGKGFGITYHENGILLRIDYIMHSKNIKSYNFTIGKVKYSDHYPVWTYISLY